MGRCARAWDTLAATKEKDRRRGYFVKRCISMILAVVLLLALVCTGSPTVHAAQKSEVSRAIGIVFDNSGTMYMNGELAWCHATYAMEVFASMLNKGDTLLVFPMSPITVDGKEYTMDNPFRVTDASQAHLIRTIYTEHAGSTPIEVIDKAQAGLKGVKADKKYMIVLTDGQEFYRGGGKMSRYTTKKELETAFKGTVNDGLITMYLGIGTSVADPDIQTSEYFAKRIAEDSANVLSSLTQLCNLVFGRNTLPKDRISGKQVNFDITMSKLIVFVQGENISNVKLTPSDNVGGTMVSNATTKYSTDGCGNYASVPDESLQGMMVTYANCAPGTYTLDYSGTATSVEVYYEPDAELDFVFTDLQGNDVSPENLYAGEYKVSFGIKDAKTKKLISSDLLGQPHYEGAYYVSGEENEILHDGMSGEKKVTLNPGDTFNARLTVTYLNGYTQTKTARDFGWDENGIRVQEKAPGELQMKISGGDKKYRLPELEEGNPYTAEVYYRGQKLTGEELKAVELKWDSSTSNAEIKQNFADDHYDLSIHYKDPAAPADTACGECTVTIYAFYKEPGCSEAVAETTMTYNIVDEEAPLKLDLYTQEDYIVISELDQSRPIIAELKLDGKAMTAEELAAVKLQVNTGGIAYTTTTSGQDSAYQIQLLSTPGIAEGEYKIDVTAVYTDPIGRTVDAKDSVKVELSNTPLLIKWLIRLGALLLAIILLILILRIRKMPKRVRPDMDGCSLHIPGVGAAAIAAGATYYAKLSGKQVAVRVEYGGDPIGEIRINKLSPGKESYLYKPSHKRSFLVKFPENIGYAGELTSVEVAGVEYVVHAGVLVPVNDPQLPYTISNGATITINGKVTIGITTKNFSAEIPLNFRK